MACKLISYDLDEDDDYEELYEAIRDLGTWWTCLESVWIVDTSDSVSDIRDELKSHIGSDDEIAVFKLSGAWASKGLSEDCSDWLYEHL
jgi:hypothetical protein